MSTEPPHVAIVVPVYRNGPCLPELARRLEAALDRPWTLRLVVDACPADGLTAATQLAASDARIGVTALATNVGQHRALARGLLDEPTADSWVCMDGDLQDPPEAVPMLLDHLGRADVAGVFAGRRGRYESRGRTWTGVAHRALLARITSLPADAGAFLALDDRLRTSITEKVLRAGAPSIVAAAGASRLPLSSIPVAREARLVGTSAWTSADRLRQGTQTIAWAALERVRPHTPIPNP